MNVGMCDKCRKVVPVTHHQQEGKEYLHKHCPGCGTVATLISNDAAQYRKKRDFMADRKYQGCHMVCLDCVHKIPNVVFVETTNRCNMNCPICITNVPAMGFQFEPRMEYFERIFKYCSELERPPSIQLFGGEPTMREDMFEIIKLAKSFGLIIRIATNGLKIAEKAYAQKVIDSGATVLIAFDGFNREMYSKLRAHGETLELKLKALENLSRHKNGKVVLMSVIDKQINGEEIPEFLKFVMNKPHIRGIYFMPLTHVWEQEKLNYQPQRTTQEDIERFIDKAVQGKAEFVPLGSLELSHIQKVLNWHVLTFAGVHANCESFTYLIQQEDKYVSVSHYLKRGFFSAVADLRALDKKAAHYASRPLGVGRRLWFYIEAGKVFLKHLNFNALFGAKGFAVFVRWLRILGKLLMGRRFLQVLQQETVLKSPNIVLEILILPFEDDYTLESDRLHLCSSCFCYIDVASDTVRSIPFCTWSKYKNEVMQEMAKKYNKEGYREGFAVTKFDNEEDKKSVRI